MDVLGKTHDIAQFEVCAVVEYDVSAHASENLVLLGGDRANRHARAAIDDRLKDCFEAVVARRELPRIGVGMRYLE